MSLSAWHWLLAVIGLMGLVACRTVDWTLSEAHVPCGVYRWKIKTLSDPDVDSIQWKPLDTTVRYLIGLPRPEKEMGNRRRTNEFWVYRVRAILLRVRKPLDQDMHLLLRDPADPNARMIAEIPNPACARKSEHGLAFASARRAAELLRAGRNEVLIEVVGVGFFDALRRQVGSAPNGFELHPVLELSEIRPRESSRSE